MKRLNRFVRITMALFVCAAALTAQEDADPFLWLEEVEGERALEWVKAQNAATIAELQKHPGYAALEGKILSVLNSRERIAFPSLVGEYVYNFWQDGKNPRGLWRRTLLADYFNSAPAWETVLDLDALSTAEGEKWAFHGANYLYPAYDRCMISLSRGGSDAAEMREFDLVKKEFVAGGFFVPQAKGGVSWKDRNTLLVWTDFGPGTLTTSGYPRQVKIWHRGTPLSGARPLFEGQQTDMSVGAGVDHQPERQYLFVSRRMTFYTGHIFVMEGDKLIRLDIPEDADFNGIFKNQMLIELKSDWSTGGRTWRQGSLISIDYDRFLMGDRNFSVVFEPGERSSLAGMTTTKNALLLLKMNNVISELWRYTLDEGQWRGVRVAAPDLGTIGLAATDDQSDHYFFTFANYLAPTSLYYVSADGARMTRAKSLPDYFDASKLMVEQLEAVSKDGTKIPFFVVRAKKARLDGARPTLLYGYGGFEVAMRPGYSAITGVAWLEQGGVYAVANIRGGGEFGPGWHQAALKENRQRAFDDFYAVAEELIRRGITSPRHLGIEGGSNGGLLVGTAFTQRPDLFNAVICSVPLLDMKRYNKLLAGASWMGEYGNPDLPEEWAYISKYSPYQNLAAGKKYPRVLFTTTTRDDRVHPGHARKMAAKMEALGYPFYYFENTEGGHGAGVTNEQRAKMIALEYIYLLKMLK